MGKMGHWWGSLAVRAERALSWLFEQKWRLIRWWRSLDKPVHALYRCIVVLALYIVCELVWSSPETLWHITVIWLLVSILYGVQGIALGWFDEERAAYRKERARRREALTWTYLRLDMEREREAEAGRKHRAGQPSRVYMVEPGGATDKEG